jgi:hypothetical protein
MATQWDEWLTKLASDGKGGLGLKRQPQMRAIDRGLAYVYAFAVQGDRSSDAFSAAIKASPDALTSLATFDVTVGTYSAGYTPLILELTALETAALPSDNDANGLEQMVFDILWTPSGGVQQRLMGGIIDVSGKVT